MTYATQDDLTARYGESMLIDLTDRSTPPSGAIDGSVVTAALEDTDALIDGYLKVRYALPLAVTPKLVTDLALPIALYKLHRNQASDKVRTDYTDALALLRQISAGQVRLDVAGVEPEASGATGVKTQDRCRDFTPDNLKGFI